MTTRHQSDPVGALLYLLKADEDVAALVEDRIYVPELSKATGNIMPINCIVMSRAGGTGVGSISYLPIRHQRVDIKCYGTTPYQSTLVYWSTHKALKGIDRRVIDLCLLHWAMEEVGPMDLREPEEDWPFTFSSWVVMAAENEVSVH